MVRSSFTAEYEVCLAVLVETRKKADFTQQELADRLGKPQSFVAKYEKRQRRIDIAEFLMIMRVLGVLPRTAIETILRESPRMNIRFRWRRKHSATG
jgi:transcriptional regulator with XRE-family HTH domain